MNIPNFQSFSKVIRFLPYPFLVVVTDQNYLSPGSRLCMCFKVAHKATVAYKNFTSLVLPFFRDLHVVIILLNCHLA